LIQAKTNNLNNKYGGHRKGPFFLFHRSRKWNPRQKAWMGYERKRGKLAELNRLLRKGTKKTDFSVISGQIAILPTIKYVITLDTDTELPRGAAIQMVGSMAHPLNRPRFDAASGRVTEGYGILQPRVDISLPSTNGSYYARLFGNDSGIDPYTRTISDVYQDVFREGSFIGKGIYDVDAFGDCFEGRLPENLILSHDLLEGCYVRSGLLSDVPLYESNPSNFLVDAKRRHRWIRGDWQIVQWLLPLVPDCNSKLKRNPTSVVSRWKILDNLRRSLTPVALTLLLVLGWLVLTPSWPALLAGLTVLFLPAILSFIDELVRRPPEISVYSHLSNVMRSTGLRILQAGFALACLPMKPGMDWMPL
jgi:hypothetical protein